MTCLAQRLKVSDSAHDRRVEDRSSGDRFDVMCLKSSATATLSTLPSISLKRQKAVTEIDFIIVLGRNRLGIGYIYDWAGGFY